MTVGGFALAQVLAAMASIVVIDAGQDHQGCPDLLLTRQEVAERVHPPEQESGEWSARYVVTQSSVPGEAQFVRLELADPAGRVRLRRELAIEGETCESVAQAIALVLERYFEDVGTDTAPSDDARAPAPEPVTVPKPAPPPPPPPPKQVEAHRMEVLFGLSTALLLPDPSAALDAELRIRFEHLSVGLRAALAPNRRFEAIGGGGSATLESVPVRATFAVDAALGPVRFAAGPELLAAIEHGETHGLESSLGISETGSGFRFLLGLGLQADALWRVSQRFGLGLAGGVDYVLPLSMSQFLIDDSPPREVLKPHDFEGFVALGPILIFQ